MDTKFLNEKLNLPLFMVSRHPLKKEDAMPKIQTYIEGKRKHFLSTWSEDLLNQENSYSYGKSRHLLGKDRVKPIIKCEPQFKSSLAMRTPDRPWKLAANRYPTDVIPYASRGGLTGAYWHKSPKTKSRKLHSMSCLLSSSCTFSTKPSRILYPHVFYRKSIVPSKRNSIHPPHISFRPGPGRYDIRYKNVCPCPSNKIYYPDLDIVAERQFRLKFRRLPYKKIKRHLYCSPDWRHVQGKGYSHIFMGAKPQIRPPTVAPEAKDKSKQLKLFQDAKYRQMVCNPTNDLGSIRKEPMPQLPTRIKFDRMVRVIY